MDETSIYDMITVFFGDQETLARPYDFTKDKNDDLVKAMKASTSCPHCGPTGNRTTGTISWS